MNAIKKNRAPWLAVIASVLGMASAAGCHSGEAAAHSGRPATTMTDAQISADILDGKRRLVTRQLHRTLGQIDEQIEMLDLTIEGREENRVPDDESEMITQMFEQMYAGRVVLAEQRERTVEAIGRLATVPQHQWVKASWAARLAVLELEETCDLAIKNLH